MDEMNENRTEVDDWFQKYKNHLPTHPQPYTTSYHAGILKRPISLSHFGFSNANMKSLVIIGGGGENERGHS